MKTAVDQGPAKCFATPKMPRYIRQRDSDVRRLLSSPPNGDLVEALRVVIRSSPSDSWLTVKKAAELMAKWGGQEAPEEAITVSTDFGPEDVESVDLEALKFARGNGDLSHEDFLEEYKNRAILRDSFDPAENDRRLAKERSDRMQESGDRMKQEQEILQTQPAGGRPVGVEDDPPT